MAVIVGNDFIRIPRSISTKVAEKIDKKTSYRVAGARFTPQYKAKLWDGRQRFMKRAGPYYIVPAGLFPEIRSIIRHMNILDNRRKPKERIALSWNGLELRDYQLESILDAVQNRGLATGKGMLNLPIRSGKTVIAAATIAHLRVPTLFVVESNILLHQTIESFADLLKAKIGIFGDGQCDIRPVTVATVQTMLSQKRLAHQLLRQNDLLFVDECHHLKGKEWGKILLRADCFYKFGLSATIFMDPNRANERDAIWFRACTGPVLSKVSVSRLIDEGYLFAPQIKIYEIREPKLNSRQSYSKLYQAGIELNETRNTKIAQLAAKQIDRGLRVLIDTGRLRQVRILYDQLKAQGYAVERMIGSTPSAARQRILRQFRNNEVSCIVGTVLGEGVDIPELEVVINAEGQKSRIATVQRMRNLTACSEKQAVIFIDFLDKTSHKLLKHSEERVKTYQGYRNFRIRMMGNA